MSEDRSTPPPEVSTTPTEPQTDAAGQLPALERSVMGSVGVALMGVGLRSARPIQKLVLGSVGAGLAAMAATVLGRRMADRLPGARLRTGFAALIVAVAGYTALTALL